MYRLSMLFFVCLIAGCGSTSSAEAIPLDKVPEQTLRKAQETLPDVKFTTAVRRSDGGLEIRGKDARGNVRDVEFSASGDVIEIE